MAWEQRRSRRYYYRKRREGGRVVSQYAGTGLLAELTAGLDTTSRDALEWKKMGIQRFRQEVEAADPALDALEDAIRALSQCTFLSLGFHDHNGAWRRRRSATGGIGVPIPALMKDEAHPHG